MAKKLNTILKSKKKYSIEGMLWIAYNGERCFGPGRVQLLHAIQKTGSINKAAKAMQMSYKKAWNMINELNQQFAAPVVITQSGGEGGGGAILTSTAKELIQYHENMRKRFEAFLEKENRILNK